MFALGDYVGMHWYMCPCDGVHVPVNVNQLTRRINQVQSVEKRYLIGGTDIYTTTSSNFDGYGFALNSHASNNFSDYEEFTARNYLHDTNNGLIGLPLTVSRSEEHTSELQSLMRLSYAVFYLKTTNSNLHKK